MKLKVLGSSSSGNCYILENDTEALIIESGISFKEVKKALNFNISKIVGVLQSHSHGDHSAHEKEYLTAGIKVYKPYEQEMPCGCYLGKFHILPIDLIHDVPCYGFYITHPEMGNLIYASDTEYIKYRFKNLSHMLIEANYSESIISRDAINREHVLRGHMSLETTLKSIQANDNKNLMNVILIHLSDKNSDEKYFLNSTKEVLKNNTDVYIADKGLEVDLNLMPF